MTDSDSDSDPRAHRRIRSFVRRPGRMTEAQKQALDNLLPVMGVPDDCTDLRTLFERPAPLIVEIGCGNGQAMAWMAEREHEHNFVAIEVHEPGVGRLLRSLHDQGSTNVRVAMRDAVEVLQEQAPPASLDQVRIYFPDPWHKKRHHKRRLIQPPFLELLAERIRPGGQLHLATDWMPYAEWMLEALAEVPAFRNLGSPFLARPAWRPQTHFERRGERRGHDIVDLLFERR